MKIGSADIVTADKNKTVGSKIISVFFWEHLARAIGDFQFPENGQALIPMNDAVDTVSCGVARRVEVPLAGYHIVEYREGPTMFVDREYAASTKSLSCVVYTKAAYVANPDCTPEEAERVKDYDYILVAVLASAGNGSPLSAGRFVHNLAGGNNAFKPENGYTIEKAIEDAKAIVAYGKEWVTVADRV